MAQTMPDALFGPVFIVVAANGIRRGDVVTWWPRQRFYTVIWAFLHVSCFRGDSRVLTCRNRGRSLSLSTCN